MRTLRSLTLLAAALAFAVTAAAGETVPRRIGRLSYLGEAKLAPGSELEGTPVGGLSSLLWHEETGRFYALSDDPSWLAPARFYTLSIDLSSDRLAEDAVSVDDVTLLTDETGATFPVREIDGESLALLPDGTLLLGSEGNVEAGVSPSLLAFDLEGRLLRRFELPAHYLAPSAEGGGDRPRGVRHNLVFEGLAVAPDGRSFFTGLEGPLHQDAPPADVGVPSWVRLARWDVASGKLTAEYVYPLEPVAQAPVPADGFRVNGLTEILALGDGRLLALERAYSSGVGNTVRLFVAGARAATDVRGLPSLEGELDRIRPMSKRLVLDLGDLGVSLDNLEGLTFGPSLPDGRRTLLLVSDDNFNPSTQFTQVLAFALDESTPPVPAIQGPGHRSPLEGDWVYGVTGVVTALDPGKGFWLQHPGDGDARTADGLYAAAGEAGHLAPGDAVRVSGRIAERAHGAQLPVTRIDAFSWEIDARKRPLPAAVRLAHEARPGSTARILPGSQIDDDELVSFDPDTDAADAWESLEGMRVVVQEPLVIGPTTIYGGIGVLADGGRGAGPRTHRGGIHRRPGDLNPERVLLTSRSPARPPSAAVGDRFDGPVVGVVDHDFGHYRVVVPELPSIVEGGLEPETTPLRGGPGLLSIATCNALNLGGDASEERMRRLAAEITVAMGAPDVVAIQEIQDDNGVTDDGTVSAALTLSRLVAAIVAAGGPRYEWVQIDPVDGMDGGRPGGNIRTALLYDAARATLERRPSPDGDERSPVVVEASAGEVHWVPNPGLVAPDDLAFRSSRKPLAVELSLDGEPLYVIAVHLNSKRGDDAPFGVRQPPVFASEGQRIEQVERIAEVVDALLAADPAARVVVLGDLNEHEFRRPVLALTEHGLVNLIENLPVSDRYSYNHEGNSQLLDHILVSPALSEGAEIDIVHMNADYPFDRQTSDHDPVVAVLKAR